MKEEEDLVSIIVPVYNAEKFLKECIESILHQSYENIELILINDGSSDSSKKIIEKYMEEDDRINLTNIENQGAPRARNIGIELSKGKYIMFMDSDDILEKNAIKTLVNSIEKNSASMVIRKL